MWLHWSMFNTWLSIYAFWEKKTARSLFPYRSFRQPLVNLLFELNPNSCIFRINLIRTISSMLGARATEKQTAWRGKRPWKLNGILSAKLNHQRHESSGQKHTAISFGKRDIHDWRVETVGQLPSNQQKWSSRRTATSSWPCFATRWRSVSFALVVGFVTILGWDKSMATTSINPSCAARWSGVCPKLSAWLTSTPGWQRRAERMCGWPLDAASQSGVRLFTSTGLTSIS